MLLDAQHKLVEAQNMLLRTELQELLETPETYEKQGRPYTLPSESSHIWQRFVTRGRNIENMRLLATPRMDKYLEQASKFLNEPLTMLLVLLVVKRTQRH